MPNRILRHLLPALLAAVTTVTNSQPQWRVLGSYSMSVVQQKGTTSEFTHTTGYTLLRRGTEVCGEWYEWSSTHMREGLLVGRIHGNTLEVKQCTDQAETCAMNTTNDEGRLQFRITTQALEESVTSAVGATSRYKKHNSTAALWETGMPQAAPAFFASCKRDG